MYGKVDLLIILICGLTSLFVKPSDAEYCFRKVKSYGICKGPMRRQYPNAWKCCKRSNAQGFAVVKIKAGKKTYECVSCKDEFGDRTPRPPKRIRTTPAPEPTWTEWSVWGPCSVTCQLGYQSRNRNCTNGPGCSGRDYEIQPCNQKQHCPVDGKWGPWFPWQRCSGSCDGGKQIRLRTCNNPPPLHDGKNCEGSAEQERECNTNRCPINGGWGSWSSFAVCSETCGSGYQIRQRSCDQPYPQFDGDNCRGPSEEKRSCHLRNCPIDGGWSLWTDWTTCTVSCGTGVIQRSRSCDSPRPRFRGRDCEGATVETKMCQVQRSCPVDGGWSSWARWSRCSAQEPCRQGYQYRSKTCTNPRPRNRGRYCAGAGREWQQCQEREKCAKIQINSDV